MKNKFERRDGFVRVVRCKDCKYRITEIVDEPSCLVFYDCYGANATVTDKDYCSWGERRDEDETD